jgi:glycosyltransferase involved in cell wall biosynthesis
MNNPLVTVVIPTYNREKLLPRAINSVLNQTYQKWELIIVDDRSTGDTEELVQDYIKKDKRIRYVKNTHNQGPAGARNQGTEVSGGEYIAFLDSDDEWKNNHLKDTIEGFEKNKDVDWIYADGEIFKDDKMIVRSIFKEHWKGKNKFIIERKGDLSLLSENKLLTNALKYGIYTGCQVSVMRKRLFEKIKFDESFYFGGIEDRLAPLEAIAKGFRLAYMDMVHLIRHVHKDSISASIQDKPVEDLLRIFKELERLYKIIPQKISLTGRQKRIINDKLADLYFWDLGYNCCLKIKDYNQAREYFLKALKLNPFNLKFWKTFIFRIILKIPI